jgi:hypothetical protein
LSRLCLTTAAVEKAIRITYSECVSVFLVIQHAMRMRRIVLSSAACPALPYEFSILSHKQNYFQKQKQTNKQANKQTNKATEHLILLTDVILLI